MDSFLTVEQVLGLQIGDQVTVCGQGWDGTPWMSEGVLTQAPRLHGYYPPHSLGMWTCYATPDEIASGAKLPAGEITIRFRRKRKDVRVRITDHCRLRPGWASTDTGWKG